MKRHPSDQKLIDFSIKILYGFAQGLDDVHQMVKHPIDNVLYPVSQFALDAAIILGNTPQMHDDPELRAWQATMNQQEGIYTDACQRMKERMSSLEQMGQAFWAADKLERVRMATRFLTSTFAPGAIIRGIKTISTLSENLTTFGTKRPTLFHNLTIEDLPVATTPWKPFTAEQVLGDRTSRFKKYIWVIVKDEVEKVKLIMAERELNAPVLLRNGHEGAYLYHPEISGFKPVYSAGELHTYDGFIQKLTDKTGHFKVQPTWDGYPGFIEKVFQDNGYTHVAGKFEFAEAGVIKQPIMTVDPLGLTPGAEAFLSMMVSTMLRGTANSISNQAHELAPRDDRKHPQQSSVASSGQSVSFSIPLPSLFGLFNHQLLGETKGPASAQLSPWHAQINVPLPSKKLSFDSSDSIEIACAKIDAYFEDIIRNYPESTQQLVREMYYRNKNVSQGELARTGAGAITWVEQNMFGMTRIKVQIDKALATFPIAIRLLKIHEIAVHAGQFHQRIEQVGFNTLVQGYEEFVKFTEQSVAIVEKILTDALPEDMLSRGFLVNDSGVLVDSTPDAWISQTNSKKEMSLDDYVHLQHRLNDKLSPAEHESFLEHPQVSAFLDHTAQQFYPGISGKVASTALYRKALEKRQLNPLSALMTAAFAERYPAGLGSTMPQQQPNPTQSQVTAGHVSSQDKSESMDDSGTEPDRKEECFEEAQQNLFDTMMTIRGGAPAKLLERLENINPLATFAKRLEEDKKNYPNASDDEYRTAAVAQTFVEEGLKKGAVVGGGAIGLHYGGKEGAAMGAFAAHGFVKPVAEAAGRVANTAVHHTYSALHCPQKAPTRHSEIPQRGRRSISMPHSVDVKRSSQRATSASPRLSYERLLRSNMIDITTRMQGHRDAFSGMGLSDTSITSAAKAQVKTHSRIPIVRRSANASEGNSLAHDAIGQIRVGGNQPNTCPEVKLPIGHSFIFSTANAAEGPSQVRPTKRHSQEAAPRDYCIPVPKVENNSLAAQSAEANAKAIYMGAVKQAQDAARALSTPKNSGAPNHHQSTAQASLSRATDLATTQITRVQVLELRSKLKQLNTTMSGIGQLDYHSVQGRLSAQQLATNIGTISHAVSDFGTIVQACGGGSGATRLIQIGANVATIADAISGLIAAKAAIATAGSLTASAAFSMVTCGLSLVVGVVSLMTSLFGDEDDEAERFSAALAEVHSDLRSLRAELQSDFHALGQVLQTELQQLRSMVGQVIENDVIIFKSTHALNDSIHEVKAMLSEHIEVSNQRLNFIAHADLRSASAHIERYLDKISVATDERSILKSLHELQFWLMSELQSPVINEVHFAQILGSERVVGLLNQYQQTGTSMPGFFAARLRYHFGDQIPAKYTQLPSLELYEKTAHLFLRGLAEVQLDGYADYERTFNHIIDTHKNALEFIEMLKNNKALWEVLFSAYSGYRHVAAQCIIETGAQQSTHLMREVANSPRGDAFKSALWSMEEQRLLLLMLAEYVDGCTQGVLSQRVLALDSLHQVCQQPQCLLKAREVLQLTDRASVTSVAANDGAQISYERALKKMLEQHEKAVAMLKAVRPKPVIAQPSQASSTPENEALDPGDRQLNARAQLFYDDEDGIDPSQFTFFQRSKGLDPKERVLCATHLTGSQRHRFWTLLNKQDGRYQAGTMREGNEIYIRVRLPE